MSGASAAGAPAGSIDVTGREVLIGVSGGIAAYKAAALVSQLVQAGAGVTVAMTQSRKNNASNYDGPARNKSPGRSFLSLTTRPPA